MSLHEPTDEGVGSGRPGRRLPLRIGLISAHGPHRPTAMSGVPYHMKLAMEEYGCTVIPLSHQDEQPSTSLTTRVQRRVRSAASRLMTHLTGRIPRRHPSAIEADLRQRAGQLADRIDQVRPDVLFGHCISTALYGLNTDIPIVYGTDLTAALALSMYPNQRSAPAAHQEHRHRVEQAAFDRSVHAVLTTELARRSAIEDYGMDEDRAHTVPLGANIVPTDESDVHPTPPDTDELSLCIIAADPVRKRVDFTIEIVEALNTMGWRARLTHIGRPTSRGERSPLVTCAGMLKLGDPHDTEQCRAILKASHLFVLPSLAEPFGIAPCEASHFAVPSVVSDSGGLAEVVQHNETGLVLPVNASALLYAQAIDALARDRDRYVHLAEAARRRAVTVYDWSQWAARVLPILADAAGYATGRANTASADNHSAPSPSPVREP